MQAVAYTTDYDAQLNKLRCMWSNINVKSPNPRSTALFDYPNYDASCHIMMRKPTNCNANASNTTITTMSSCPKYDANLREINKV